jgi:O-acetyl-ADP-ribose deacetylase
MQILYKNGMMGVFALKGDIVCFSCDAIVNPANSYGTMGGGVAYAIKKTGGKGIEDEAVALAPIDLASAVATSSGALPCRLVIHASTMVEPVERVSVENVYMATRAALECALKNNVSSLAFPGLGTGVGGVDVSCAAEAMVSEITSFNLDYPVYLIGFNDVLTFEFMRWIRKLIPRTR